MRIEGHQSHGLTNQRRVDSEHPTKAAEKTTASGKQELSKKSHLSQFRSRLIGELRQIPEIREQEVQRVSERLRLGYYSTQQSAQNTAAAILAGPQRLV